MSFMDDFESVMNKVMGELKVDEAPALKTEKAPVVDKESKEIFGEDVTFNVDSLAQMQDAADTLIQTASVEPETLFNPEDIMKGSMNSTPAETLSFESKEVSASDADFSEIGGNIYEIEQAMESELNIAEEPETIENEEIKLDEFAHSMADSKEVYMPTKTKAGNGSLSIDLEGMIGIDIRLSLGDKELYLSCDGDNVIIKLSDGASFTLPLKSELKKAA